MHFVANFHELEFIATKLDLASGGR